MTLSNDGTAFAPLLAALPEVRVLGEPPARIVKLAYDSRALAPGDAFVAMRGSRADGHSFIAQALQRGARAVVVDVEAAAEQVAASGGCALLVPDAQRALSRLAAAYYGEPSHGLEVLGVTGTNGKTTTTFMIAAILEAAGIPCGRIGTLGAEFAGRSQTLANTTPLALDLQAMLADMRARGARAVAMEVSSHALAQDRVADVRFAVGALTNLTRDHLDFHGSLEAYAAAKRRLFERAARAVLNLDDAYGARWAREFPALTYGVALAAHLRPQHVAQDPSGSRFAVDGTAFSLPLPGAFNVLNALAAIGVARELGIADAIAAQALGTLGTVPGRMERFGDGSIDVFVDYAHTPDGLERVLQAARELAAGNVIVAFGCGGDRDRGKRPLMGAVANLADRIVITSDNPRSEDAAAIAGEILAGVVEPRKVSIELDRARAIRSTVLEAKAGDVVLIAGKGHEPYQLVGDRSYPFDDREHVRSALAEREQRPAVRS